MSKFRLTVFAICISLLDGCAVPQAVPPGGGQFAQVQQPLQPPPPAWLAYPDTVGKRLHEVEQACSDRKLRNATAVAIAGKWDEGLTYAGILSGLLGSAAAAANAAKGITALFSFTSAAIPGAQKVRDSAGDTQQAQLLTANQFLAKYTELEQAALVEAVPATAMTKISTLENLCTAAAAPVVPAAASAPSSPT